MGCDDHRTRAALPHCTNHVASLAIGILFVVYAFRIESKTREAYTKYTDLTAEPGEETWHSHDALASMKIVVDWALAANILLILTFLWNIVLLLLSFFEKSIPLETVLSKSVLQMVHATGFIFGSFGWLVFAALSMGNGGWRRAFSELEAAGIAGFDADTYTAYNGDWQTVLIFALIYIATHLNIHYGSDLTKADIQNGLNCAGKGVKAMKNTVEMDGLTSNSSSSARARQETMAFLPGGEYATGFRSR